MYCERGHFLVIFWGGFIAHSYFTLAILFTAFQQAGIFSEPLINPLHVGAIKK